MTVALLLRGQNVQLPGGAVLVRVGSDTGHVVLVDLDAADGCRSTVLPGEPAPGGAPVGRTTRVALDTVSPETHSLLVVLAVPGSASAPLAAPPVDVEVLADEDSAGATPSALARFLSGWATAGELPVRALVLVELYRRAGGWKLRAVGQGYAAGLPELLARHRADPRSLVDVPDQPTDSGIRYRHPRRAAGNSSDQGSAAAGSEIAADRTAIGPPAADPGAAGRQPATLQGIFQDAARSTAGYRSAVEYAGHRRDRELQELLADPRSRSLDHPARLAVDRRYDKLVLQATSAHQRDITTLRRELDGLPLAPQLAGWRAASWHERQGGRPGGGIRIGEIHAEESPELRIPLVLPAPLLRPMWLDGDGGAADAMAVGVVLRLLMASRPGGTRVRVCDARGTIASVLSSAGRAVLHGPSVGTQAGTGAVIEELVHRADLLAMADEAGDRAALPAGVFAGEVILVLRDLTPGDEEGFQALGKLLDRHSGVSLILVGSGSENEAFATGAGAQVLPSGPGGRLTDHWVGINWAFEPDPGPEPDQARLLLSRMT